MKTQLEAYVGLLETQEKIAAGKGEVLVRTITRELEDLTRCPYALYLINTIMRAGVDPDSAHAAWMMKKVVGFIEATEADKEPTESSNPTLIL